MRGFETQFCDCCSLSKKKCSRKNLYSPFLFYNYEKWANKNCPSGKKCDVLFEGSRGLIFIELKALDYLMNIDEAWRKETDENKRKGILAAFEDNLKEKFRNSKKNLLSLGMFPNKSFLYYLVAISYNLIDYYGKYKDIDRYQLKYYLRNKFSFNENNIDSTCCIVEECTQLESYFQQA